MDEVQIQRELQKYKFYHVIQLTENIYTPGWQDVIPNQQLVIRALKSLDVRGKKVLDIGCRDGLLSFESEKLHAEEVIGIDNDLSPAAINFLIPYFNSRVKMYELNLFDLQPTTFGLFDIVIFSGVLYHLRYPFWALKLIKDVLVEGGKLIVETGIFVDNHHHAMLFCPTGDDSPYEQTSCTFFNLKGLVDTLHSLDLKVESFETLYNPVNVILDPNICFNPPPPLSIERVVAICCKQSRSENMTLTNYWDKTHNFHTNNEGSPENKTSQEINLIVFPDWSQPEESLSMELSRVIRALVNNPERSCINLLVYTDIPDEDANIILSSVTMNLLMQEDLDVTDGPKISLMNQVGDIQWQALLPRIQARIMLEHENKQAIAQAGAANIPTASTR